MTERGVCEACGVYDRLHPFQVTRDLRTLHRARLCIRCVDRAEAEVQAALEAALRPRVPA